MNDGLYFEGDPGTDSTRRHLERVLNNPQPARRWPWFLAALGSGGVWLLWHWARSTVRPDDATAGAHKR